MTGQELTKLRDSMLFKPVTMNTILGEFVPNPNAFMLTEAFLPFKEVSSDMTIDLINNGAFGRTSPINLGADHQKVSIPGFSYKQHTPGRWRESVVFGEDELARAVNPATPLERYGEAMAAAALNFLDTRLNNLIEYTTAKLLINGTYSEARYGVNYTYDPKIPAKYYRNITSSPGFTTGGTWATLASSTPYNDIMELANIARKYGLNPVKVWGSVKTLGLYVNSADTQTRIKASFQLIGQNPNRETIFGTLAGLPFQLDSRLYAEESRLTTANAISDTVINLTDATDFAVGDVITMRNSVGGEEEVTIASKNGNAVTVSALTLAYLVGDRATVYKTFMPDNYIILQCESNDRVAPNNWLSTPSLVKGQSWSKPAPGRYTWTTFKETVPYSLEIGGGIDGGPKISRANYLVWRIVA